MSIKHSIGKLPIDRPDLEELEAYLIDDMFIGIIGLNEQESLSFSRLPFFSNHRDPFNRMLAWQAIKRNMALISADPAFEHYRKCGLRIIW
jgi:PIN domain nuclease of toxin-antitoxin system